MRFPRTLLILAAACASVPAAAQDIGPALDPGLMVGWTAGAAVQHDLEQRAARAPLSMRGLLAAPRASDAPLPPAAALSFRPDPAVRKANYAQFIAKTRAVDPQGASQLEHLLATTDVMAEAQKWMGRYGMHTTDVADALAVYLATAWYTIRADTSDPTPGQLRGLRNQLARAIGATPEFASASDAMKQQLSEANLIQALILSSVAEQAKKNPELRPKVAEAVAQGARNSYGFDLRGMALTDHGLVPA
ncbi:hypothetical protein EWE75_07205 [Sphingomonas populi]|uniref:DUF885 family protein n=1 Tax=Sphingomonas populi TaxID=2484750 RepID=A0A4Q6XXL6_9SPHN|nr:DUF6683 family protein [Sphingomonas populi]RZF65150.1 hypothetical protein EWE75_07205 [Sphingomonas populi]